MDHLGVNKMGKNIKKTPLQQPNFANPNRQQPQPQVYNINKNDFRNIVQQLTGSPVREQPPRPPQNHPKPPNHRLQRVRPPPLAPTARPHIPVHPQQQPNPPPYPNSYTRPHFDQISPRVLLPPTPTDVWANTTESPISAYMRYLQNSIIDSSGPLQNQHHPQMPFQPGQNPAQPHLQPNHPSPRFNGPPPNLPSPRFNGPPPNLPSRFNGPPPNLPSPRFSGPPTNLPSPRFCGPPSNLPSPRFNGSQPILASPHMNGPPPLLPSPGSQFVLPSPSGFFGLLSPRSPYPWPISPNFSFSSVGQSGILGPGPHPPPSPGYGFPLSPSGFFPVSSPRWRNQ